MQHCLGEPEYPRIVGRGLVSDLAASPEVCLAATCQDDGVSTLFVGCDTVRGLVDDAIAVGSGRLDPPAFRMLGKNP